MPCGQIYLQNSDSAEYYPEDSAGRTYIDHICLKNNYNYYSASSSEIIQGYNNILKLGRIGGSHTPTPVRIFSPHFSALPARTTPKYLRVLALFVRKRRLHQRPINRQ